MSEVKPTKLQDGPGARTWRWYLKLWPAKVNTETVGGYPVRAVKWGLVRRAPRRQLVNGKTAYVYLNDRM
jgi:hypothetical protein